MSRSNLAAASHAAAAGRQSCTMSCVHSRRVRQDAVLELASIDTVHHQGTACLLPVKVATCSGMPMLSNYAIPHASAHAMSGKITRPFKFQTGCPLLWASLQQGRKLCSQCESPYLSPDHEHPRTARCLHPSGRQSAVAQSSGISAS